MTDKYYDETKMRTRQRAATLMYWVMVLVSDCRSDVSLANKIGSDSG